MYAMVSLFLSVASVMLSTGMAVGALNPALNILAGFFNETHMVRIKISFCLAMGVDFRSKFFQSLSYLLCSAAACNEFARTISPSVRLRATQLELLRRNVAAVASISNIVSD